MKHSTSESYSITRCASKTVKPILTNEDWIHTLNTEQLAGWLSFLVYDIICQNGGRGVEEENEEYWLEWLKQPHTTKE